MATSALSGASKLCQAHHWTIPTKLEAMWCSRKLRSMVAAGPCGVDGDGFGCARHDGLAETVGEDARAGAGHQCSYALTTIPQVAEDMLDLYEWVIEGRTVIVEGMGADIAHELGEQVVFALEEAVERGPTHMGASDDVADGDLAVVLFAQQARRTPKRWRRGFLPCGRPWLCVRVNEQAAERAGATLVGAFAGAVADGFDAVA